MARYDAFISYSHQKDRPIAAALQAAIQKLGKPWYRRRALRLFRDDTSLSATPHLWPTIEQALSQSSHFVLLAAPEAAASKWVNKEVAYWLEHNSVDTLLVGLTDGELKWDDAAGDFALGEETKHPLPPTLARKFPNEPKWVDLRPYREGAKHAASKRDAKFTELAADFAAAIRGMPKEDLLSQEVRQQRGALRLAVGAAAALLILAAAATVAGLLAYRSQQEAIAQRNRAEQTLATATKTANGLVFDLAQRFRYTAGVPVSLIKDILDRARALQDQLVNSGQTTPDIQYSEAAALLQTARLLREIGDTSGALSAAQRAYQISRGLLSEYRNYETDWKLVLALAQSQLTIGDIMTDQSDMATALKWYGASLDLLHKLVEFDPNKGDWQHHLVLAYLGIGRTQEAQLDFASALKSYRDAFAISDKLTKSDPSNVFWQHDLSQCYKSIGDVQGAEGDLTGAIDSFRKGLAIDDRLVKSELSNVFWKVDLVISYGRVGDIQRRQGNFEDALASYESSYSVIAQLANSDQGNASLQQRLAAAEVRLAEVEIKLGRLQDAAASYRNGLTIMDRLAKADPGNTVWQEQTAALYKEVGLLQVEQHDLAGAIKSYRAGLAIIERLAQANPDDAARQRDLIFCYMMVAKLDPSQARMLLTRAADLASNMQSKGILAPSDFWIPEELARKIAALPN
jgi:tetratricopeptide (TPR) repeat protein